MDWNKSFSQKSGDNGNQRGGSSLNENSKKWKNQYNAHIETVRRKRKRFPSLRAGVSLFLLGGSTPKSSKTKNIAN